MKRLLSQTLITILLLICPLTFSTDELPNFKPDCETSSYHREKSAKTVVVARRSGISAPRIIHEYVKRIFPVISPASSIINCLLLPHHDRAPPLFAI